MLPKKKETGGDFFKVELAKIINKNYPLVRLSDSIKWEELEESINIPRIPVRRASRYG